MYVIVGALLTRCSTVSKVWIHVENIKHLYVISYVHFLSNNVVAKN